MMEYTCTDGYLGRYKTLWKITSQFWKNFLNKDILVFLMECDKRQLEDKWPEAATLPDKSAFGGADMPILIHAILTLMVTYIPQQIRML